jgi:hypothetical protein
MYKLNVGDKLIATNPCKMLRSLEDTLTIGKEYEILSFEGMDNFTCIVIMDDKNDEHLFPVNELKDYFDVSKLPLYISK